MRRTPHDRDALAARDFVHAANNLVSEVLLYIQKLDSDEPPSRALGEALSLVGQASETLRRLDGGQPPAPAEELLAAAECLDRAADAFQNARLSDGYVDVPIALIETGDAEV